MGRALTRPRSDDDGLEGPELCLDARVASHVVDRNGNGGPTIWVEGRVVSSWVQRADGTIALKRELGDTLFTMRFSAPIQAELLSS